MSREGHRVHADRATVIVSALAFLFGIAWLVGIFVVFRQTEVVDGQVQYVLGDHWGYDIEAYVRAAGRFIDEGSLYLRQQIDAPYLPGGKDYYHYSPPLGVALIPLAGLAEHDSSAVWYILKVGALLGACLMMPVKLPVRALTFVGVAVSFWAMRDLVLGNVGVLLALPLVVAWRWLDRPLGSIALAAAISVRPSLGALLLWQLLRGRWRVAAWTVAAGIGLIVLTLPFVGFDGYRDYISVLGNMVTPGAGSENRDLGATLVTLGLDARWIDLVRLGSIVLGGMFILLSLRRDRELGFIDHARRVDAAGAADVGVLPHHVGTAPGAPGGPLASRRAAGAGAVVAAIGVRTGVVAPGAGAAAPADRAHLSACAC